MNSPHSSAPHVATPSVNPWMPQMARIASVKQEAPGIATCQLELEDASLRSAFYFLPGQFNMLYVPGFGESAISISTDPEVPGTIGHTIRTVGNVTRAIARLKPGAQIALRGPFGSFWPVVDCRDGDLVIACGGVGLAPLRPVIYHVLGHRGDFGRVLLLYGARTPGDLLFTDEYDQWRSGGIEVNVTVDLGDENWQGQIGVVPVLFQRLRLNAQSTRIMTCGPEIMMRFVVREALTRKIRHKHIYLSMERNMNCALGFCGHCQLGPAFVCKDGPVFTYQQMEPYLNLEDF
jgi:NAD(P)H-flavin reductase